MPTVGTSTKRLKGLEGHWIRTGDKYYQDEAGDYWYDGRTDDMVKVSGVWVRPIEVERVLSEHPAVPCAANRSGAVSSALPSTYLPSLAYLRGSPFILYLDGCHVPGP